MGRMCVSSVRRIGVPGCISRIGEHDIRRELGWPSAYIAGVDQIVVRGVVINAGNTIAISLPQGTRSKELSGERGGIIRRLRHLGVRIEDGRKGSRALA